MKNNTLFMVMMAIFIAFLSNCKKDHIDHTTIPQVNQVKIPGWEIDSTSFAYHRISPTDVNFLSLKTGYILGSNGYLIKTTDAAISWKQSYIEKDSSGVMTRAMSFINDSTGYIYGTSNVLNGNFYGVLYRTMDGGSHWTKQYYNTAYHFNSMKFFDIQHGVALNGGNSGPYVVTTDNGGLSWEVVHLDLNPYIYKLFFSGDICFATSKNEDIFKSTDHGKTWVTIKTPTGSSSDFIHGYYFQNESIGLLNKGHYKYKTTDGGQQWTQLDQSFPDFGIPYSPFEKLHFCNNNEGIIFRDSAAYIGGDFPSYIGSYTYTTSDGGKSWIKSDLNKQLALGFIVFVTNNFAYGLGYDHIYRLQKK